MEWFQQHVEPAAPGDDPAGRARAASSSSASGAGASACAPRPLFRAAYSAGALARDHPPAASHALKRALYVHTMRPRPGEPDAPPLVFSRWPAAPPPARAALHRCRVSVVCGTYTYDAAEARGERAWHMNFADRRLFAFYGGPLFAQDEWMVAEHPALASLREALLAEPPGPGGEPLTWDDRVAAETPCLVANVQRRATFAPELYGSRFARATEEEVLRGTTLIEPPTLSNVVAAEAPKYGRGEYTRQQVDRVLSTAHSAFRATVAESVALAEEERGAREDSVSVVVHTGAWGCGAFGGNLELMATLQFAAARAARVDRIVYHAANEAAHTAATEAMRTIDALPDGTTLDKVVKRVMAKHYVWGHSDGQ